jgi:hypothetical protein
MAKKPEPIEDDELESIPVTVGPARGGNSALMTPINKGRSVNLRPSAETIAEMKKRGVTRVSAKWDKSKKVLQLTILPAKEGEGLKVRYDGTTRPCVHVPTKDVGTAVLGDSSMCEGEKIDGAAIRFQLPSSLSFVKG